MNMSIKRNHAIYMSVNIAFQQTYLLTHNIIFIWYQSHNSHTGGGTAPDPPQPDGVWPKYWSEQWSRAGACLPTCGYYAVPRPAPYSQLVWSPGATTVPLDPAQAVDVTRGIVRLYIWPETGAGAASLDRVSATPSWAQTMSSLARPDYCALTCALLVPPGGGNTWQNRV